MSKEDEFRLLQQATIVSTMMLAVTRAMQGEYRRKHVGARWEELLVAFVLWQADTTLKPMTIADIAKSLGIPRSNVSRAILELVDQGLICRIERRYGRDVGFISGRPNSRHFRDIREAIIRAGSDLQVVFKNA